MEAQVRRIAEKYLQGVKPAGPDDLRSNCPLCGRKRTFVISLRYGMWWCFGCQERGGLLQILSKVGLTRKQVDRIGKELALQPPLPRRVRQIMDIKRRHEITELPEYILGAYATCPLKLLEAGFEEELLQKHDVGFDKGNDRITFPIRDHMGRLVAINGRALDDDAYPRYKVYDAHPPSERPPRPAGELYGLVENYHAKNREYLYGFNDVFPVRFFNAKEKHAPLIIVEGYKACLWLRQLGFEHTVALQGSSMTATQRRLLNKLRGPYYLLLDHEPGKAFPDDRGRCAAVTIAERLSSAGRVFLCMYPGFTDEDPYSEKPERTAPDDLNKSEVNNIVESAQTLSQLIARTDNTKWRRT